MILLAYITSEWHLVALFALMGLVGLSGPGALVTSVPVLKWFVRRRGTAVAFVGLGIPVGAMIFVPLTQYFIDIWGWRTAWIVLAIIGMGIIVPLALVFVRRRPEDMGLQPDGLPSNAGVTLPPALPTSLEKDWRFHGRREKPCERSLSGASSSPSAWCRWP